MTKKAISKFTFLLFWYLIFEGKSFVEIMPTWTGRIINTERNLSSPLTVLRGCFCFSVLFGMITVKDSGSPFSHLWHLKRKHNDKNFEPGMNIMGPRHYGQLAYPPPPYICILYRPLIFYSAKMTLFFTEKVSEGARPTAHTTRHSTSFVFFLYAD